MSNNNNQEMMSNGNNQEQAANNGTAAAPRKGASPAPIRPVVQQHRPATGSVPATSAPARKPGIPFSKPVAKPAPKAQAKPAAAAGPDDEPDYSQPPAEEVVVIEGDVVEAKAKVEQVVSEMWDTTASKPAKVEPLPAKSQPVVMKPKPAEDKAGAETLVFQPANPAQKHLKLLLMGMAGSGKTFTALTLAHGFGGKVAVVDTEHGSASLYAAQFPFDVVMPQRYHPETFIRAIEQAAAAGYKTIVIDSLTHAWIGEDGGLDLHDDAVARQRTQNAYTAWSAVTPIMRKLIDTILSAPIHVIATLRTKVEYVETVENGRRGYKRAGTEPIFRAGADYEFDLVGELNAGHDMVIVKSRFSAMDNQVIARPDDKLARQLISLVS